MYKTNPVLKKEWKSITRNVKTFILMAVYNIILAAISLFVMYSVVDRSRYGYGINYSSMLTLYVTMAFIEMIMIILIVPAVTSNTISGERERQTLDLLIATKMRPIRIIMGKLESSLGMILLLVISSIPVLSVVFVFGGIRYRDLIVLIFILVISAVLTGSIGLMFSALMKRTMVAIVMSYISILLLFLGTIGIVQGIYEFISLKNMEYAVNTQPSVGAGIYILLFNPAISFFAMLGKQTGDSSMIEQFFENFGVKQGYIMSRWIEISLILQLLLAGLFLWISAKAINPLKKKPKKQ